MSQVTTHVLDAAFGTPAVGVGVTLDRQTADGWSEVGSGATDKDGRIPELGPDRLEGGIHRLTFATGDYFDATGRPSFYPEVQVHFRLSGTEHYHVPLLLSPFSYSTYRGS
ncbi:hydroxyisourate hydrolase [Amnibacterium setariae]|uniref:5-hydroxyisourate hydrolase n=1 Tax=Amnibacterium setariae TaxID=2306585 RepID=A0A3A1TXJ0_9MICO|nr:hydroxyisourate hydrolase [Amnibacterium setariae]RIX26429.1 hydroxyisourate hydrolase [Amnibacterium setariae]